MGTKPEKSSTAGGKKEIFSVWADFVLARPILVLAIIFVSSSILISRLPQTTIDVTIEGYLEADSAERQSVRNFRRHFGRDDFTQIGIETDSVFTPEFALSLQKFQNRIENELPYVWRVDSLLNARHVYGKEDELIVEDLFASMPTSISDAERLQTIVSANPYYENTVVSKDGKLAILNVRLLPFAPGEDGDETLKNISQDEFEEFSVALHQLISEFPEFEDHIWLSGLPEFSAASGSIMRSDFTRFGGLAFLIVTVTLLIIFRRPSGVLFPLITLTIALLTTVGLMSWNHHPIQFPTSILPSFLLAVCVGDSVHLLSLFFRKYDAERDKPAAMKFALMQSGRAMFFTSATTAAGLASFSQSDLFPIANLGIYGAIGSGIAFVLTVTVLPALIQLLPVKPRPVASVKQNDLIARFAKFSTHFAQTRPKSIVGCSSILCLLFIVLAAQNRYVHDGLSWFQPDHPVRIGVETMQEKTGGANALEIVVDTGKERGIVDVDLLSRLDVMLNELSQYDNENVWISKVVGLPDLVKETNQGLHGNAVSYYTIPDSNDLLAQELLLVELDSGKELRKFTDFKMQRLRSTLIIPWVDSFHYTPFIKAIRTHIDQALGDKGTVEATGFTAVMATTFSEMMLSTGESYLLASMAITIMMILLLGGVPMGVVSMFPNLLPIIAVLGLMTLLNIPMDLFTMLIGSIAIGLTVDDTVHFMHGFKKRHQDGMKPADAIEQTLLSSGRAMIVTSVVISLGFLVYACSELTIFFSFGILTAVCVALALLADFWLAPALMILMCRRDNSDDIG